MNQGLFGFPSAYGLTDPLSIAEYDSSGVYKIPNGAKELDILLIGAGGGGGGGGYAAAGAAAAGGGGGGGGDIIKAQFSTLPIGENSSLIITIGSAGLGGTYASSVSTGLHPGGVGGSSIIRSSDSSGQTSSSSGFLITAKGGNGSPGAAGGVAGIQIIYGAMITTAGAGQTSLAGISTLLNILIGSGPSILNNGGAAGSGVSTANTSAGGGTGGSIALSPTNKVGLIDTIFIGGTTMVSGGNMGITYGGAGQNGINFATRFSTNNFGLGGGGGASVGTTVAGTRGGTGGNGYRGGGGGGGGAVHGGVGVTSGAGGNGGNGYCCIVARG